MQPEETSKNNKIKERNMKSYKKQNNSMINN